MERWEYFCEVVEADMSVAGVKEHVRAKARGFENSPRYSPVALTLRMDIWGDQGWELVHMEPIPKVGGNHDIGYYESVRSMNPNFYNWSRAYFCVYKRLKQQP